MYGYPFLKIHSWIFIYGNPLMVTLGGSEGLLGGAHIATHDLLTLANHNKRVSRRFGGCLARTPHGARSRA